MPVNLQNVVQNALEDVKGQDILMLDVIGLSDVMDYMFIATGTSNRHVKSLANNVIDDAKKAGIRSIGVEGMEGGEWVLVDFGDTVVHVMGKVTRDLYELEKLWSIEPSSRNDSPSAPE